MAQKYALQCEIGFRKDVTDYAKNIFGDDLVLKAEFVKKGDADLHPDVIIEEDWLGPIDSIPLRVTFCNGNTVEIWTSEWGGVSKVQE